MKLPRLLSPLTLSRPIGLLLSSFIILISSLGAAESAAPNIVLIFADDLGWADVGYHGHTDFYETPHIDKLAKSGMVFTNAYAAAGNCAPSRACLLSGNYTPRHHVYAVTSTDRGPKNLQRLVPIPNKSGLAPSMVTVADALKSAGYATGIFGKWHLDGKDGAEPGDQGSDTVVEVDKDPNKRKHRPEDPKGMFTITRETLEFAKKSAADKKPFFAYVSHFAPHSAHEARPATLKKFQEKKPGEKHANALYAACIYDLDTTVGLLIEGLEKLGLAENTLVIFTSDNGGTPVSLQEPLRGNKGAYYDGGIREPFVAYWPGKIPAGTTNATPVINVDLFPTFLAAAGAPVPAGKILDGESLLPLFTQSAPALQRPSIFWHFPGYLDDPIIRPRDPVFRSRPVSVIRSGDWKLHLYHEEFLLDGGIASLAKNRCVELYNMTADPGERHDLAQKEPARRDALLAELQAWLKSTNALVPTTANPAFEPGAKPEKKGRGKGKNKADSEE